MNKSGNSCARSQKQSGLTLIELMIVVAIVGILALIAVPSYRQYTVKANRAAAESFLLNVANKQEQYILDARQYATTLAMLGIAAPPDVSKNYTIAVAANNAATPPTYTITATPTGSQLANDTQCGTVSIDQAGNKLPATSGCW